MRRAIGVIAMHILLGASVAEAGDRLSLYSDACWHREAGDLLGYRIAVIRLSDASYVFVQAAEGEWSEPSVGKSSANDLVRGKLVFSILDGGKPISFRGTISEKMIEGRFDGLYGFKGEPLVVRLKRVPASSKAVPDCR